MRGPFFAEESEKVPQVGNGVQGAVAALGGGEKVVSQAVGEHEVGSLYDAVVADCLVEYATVYGDLGGFAFHQQYGVLSVARHYDVGPLACPAQRQR